MGTDDHTEPGATARRFVAPPVHARCYDARAMRSRRPFALLAVLALLCSGCTREIANPFASFESRCAGLPPASYEIVEVPLQFEENDGVGIAELTTKSGSSMARHRTFGLTTASFGHETQTELRFVKQRLGGRACATPRVVVRLSMQPVVVYVARELADDRCRHDATREHELKHVEVDRDVLEQAARTLREQLAPAMGTATLQGASGVVVEKQYEATLREYLSAFMREQHRRLAERQAEIDSPEEYARVAGACRPA
jgi:hypothetical protein